MKRVAPVALLLWIVASLLPLAGQAETHQSRFASLWTREAAFTESELLALSKDAEPVARQFAALRLAELDPPPKAALAALVRALGDPAEEVRWQALAGLMRLGRPATSVLAKALSDLEPVVKADFEPMGSFEKVVAESGEREVWPISRADLAFAALVYARDVDVDALLSAYRAAPREPREAGEGEDIDVEGTGSTGETKSVSPRQRIRLVLEQLPPQSTPSLQAALRSKDIALRTAAEKMMEEEVEDYAVPLSASGEEVAALLKDQKPEVRLAALEQIQNPEAMEVFPGVQCQSLKKSPPELLARFPASSLPDVMALARDEDAQIRGVAVDALGSLGCARPDLATAVADALFAVLSDEPTDEILSYVVSLLANLMDQGFLPVSVTLDAVIAVLADSGRERAHSVTLEVLQHMELPEARRKELVEVLVTACLRVRCSSVQKILRQRPAWVTDAVNSLLARYPDVQSYDLSAFNALEALGAESPIYAREMERLLDHPDQWLRFKAATALAERKITLPRVWQVLVEEALVARFWGEKLNAAKALTNLGEQYMREVESLLDHSDRSLRLSVAIALAERQISPPRVWQVLEDEVRYVNDTGLYYSGQDIEASASALAGLGEQGIERLIAAIGSTTPARRVESMGTLAKFAGESSQAADVILAAASNPADPAQQVAVEALDSIKSRQDEVRAALEKAFSTGNVLVRRAVVVEWSQTGQAPGDLVERAFADPALREETYGLVERLLGDDPRRLTLTAAALQEAALQDELWWKTDPWFKLAGELGEPGAALLAQYASHGKPLTSEFFEGIERMGSLGGALAVALGARLPGEPPEVQGRIFDLLNGIEKEAPWYREWLHAQLKAPGATERERAANALFFLQEDPWAQGGVLAAVLMEVRVRNIVKERLADALYLLNTDYFGWGDSGFPIYGDLPQFPWPPPPGYRRVVVPRELFTIAATTTFGDVYRRLVDAVTGDGFEHGLFLGPGDGFSLVARMERIEADGTPLPRQARWMEEGSPKLSLVDLLADLFFEKTGYFRQIVFAITNDLAPGHSATARLPEPDEGAAGIPPELARRLFGGKEVLALVYTFERRRDAKIKAEQWNGAPSAEEHLEKAGVLPRLKAAATRR